MVPCLVHGGLRLRMKVQAVKKMMRRKKRCRTMVAVAMRKRYERLNDQGIAV